MHINRKRRELCNLVHYHFRNMFFTGVQLFMATKRNLKIATTAEGKQNIQVSNTSVNKSICCSVSHYCRNIAILPLSVLMFVKVSKP